MLLHKAVMIIEVLQEKKNKEGGSDNPFTK
jgi:hypothetical protein